MVSHSFHFFSAFFLLFALLGLAVQQAGKVSLTGAAVFVVAFAGTTLFAATGMFTAWIWPVLANHAPFLTEVSGPFFTPPHPAIGVSAVLFSAGFVGLAVGLTRSGFLPAWGGASLALGALLLAIPPTPITSTPWIVFVLGGVFMGTGFVSLSYAVRAGGVQGRPVNSGAPTSARALHHETVSR